MAICYGAVSPNDLQTGTLISVACFCNSGIVTCSYVIPTLHSLAATSAYGGGGRLGSMLKLKNLIATSCTQIAMSWDPASVESDPSPAWHLEMKMIALSCVMQWLCGDTRPSWLLPENMQGYWSASTTISPRFMIPVHATSQRRRRWSKPKNTSSQIDLIPTAMQVAMTAMMTALIWLPIVNTCMRLRLVTNNTPSTIWHARQVLGKKEAEWVPMCCLPISKALPNSQSLRVVLPLPKRGVGVLRSQTRGISK